MGHWYTGDGTPMHWVEGANGKQRDTTLRDARKLNLYPSVTTILGILDKPGLHRAKESLLIERAWEYGVTGASLDTSSIYDEALAHWDEAREVGEEIHRDIEYIFNGIAPTTHPDIAHRAVEAICEHTDTPRHEFIPEKTIVGDGYGGMIDLHNDKYVIDWKTKDIKNGKLAYPDMCMQLVAYDKALGGPERKLVNVFVDRKQPGRIVIHEWSEGEAIDAWEKFQLLVKYWQLDKGYVPGQ